MSLSFLYGILSAGVILFFDTSEVAIRGAIFIFVFWLFAGVLNIIVHLIWDQKRAVFTMDSENLSAEWLKEPNEDRLFKALELADQDPAAGVRALAKMSDETSPLAPMYLGAAYTNGRYGLPVDDKTAEELLRRSAERGSTEGGFRLVRVLMRNGATKEAISLLEELASRDFQPALYKLGVRYFYGQGIIQDIAKAEHFLGRAVELGHLASVPALFHARRRSVGL